MCGCSLSCNQTMFLVHFATVIQVLHDFAALKFIERLLQKICTRWYLNEWRRYTKRRSVRTVVFSISSTRAVPLEICKCPEIIVRCISVRTSSHTVCRPDRILIQVQTVSSNFFNKSSSSSGMHGLHLWRWFGWKTRKSSSAFIPFFSNSPKVFSGRIILLECARSRLKNSYIHLKF